MIRCSFINRNRVLVVALSLVATGCAAGRIAVSKPQQETHAPVEKVVAARTPADPVYDLLRQSFAARTDNPAYARRLLDSLAVLLPERFVPPPDSGTAAARRLTGLVRAAIECYHTVLPPTTVLPPDSPLARLLDALPQPVADDLSNHPYYANFYIRKLAGQADVPIDYTPEVASYVRYFSTEGHDFFARWLSRSTAYMPMIQAIFHQEGLPHDLAYKAMIESGFQPTAESWARAVGLWQFMYSTASNYGLKHNTWVDERRQPEKATRAAAIYLKNLYDEFGDWRLVIAAYNCGEGRMERAIREAGTRDFWKINTLPTETRNHLPKFMAAVIICKDPAWFGFDDVTYQPPIASDSVAVEAPVSLRLAAQCTGTTYAWMQQLNPELHRGYTPPTSSRRPYMLRVPEGTAEKFKANYARVPDSKKIQMVHYTVKPGDTISGIAARLGLQTQAILDANGIIDPRKMRAGRTLAVPIHPDRRVQLAQRQRELGDRYSGNTYTVQNGDTLWDIARHHGITVDQLRDLNDLGASKPIHPGDRLALGRTQVPTDDYYTVQSGDTLWDIAQHQGITVAQLRGLNDLKASKPIRPGDRLVLGRARVSAEAYYTVQNGDTLWDIARMFQTSVSDLKVWNSIHQATDLRAGARIRVRPASDDKVAE